MKIIFMGTPLFALPALRALYESEHEVVAVYTQPPRPAGRGQKEQKSPVHQFADDNNIAVYTPVSLKTEEAQKEFASHKADVAVVAAYGLLLPEEILQACPSGCINIHPSLLPRWRGAAPIQRTIMAGDIITGICIMQMDVGLDTGDILLKEDNIKISNHNAGELHDLLAEKSAALLLNALRQLDTLKPMKQAEEGVIYAKKITKEERAINWASKAQEIYNQIRGLSPQPAAYFTYNGENIKIFSANLVETSDNNQFPVGSTVDDELTIACEDGLLKIEEVQRPNKKRMHASEMLKSFPINKGVRLL
ncbi:MAG: methionyl-tRNA formyltransferase [Rickettsiales bacterium]